ncbi:MAG: alkaline phosphatase family protein [Acidobacteriota bacterium]
MRAWATMLGVAALALACSQAPRATSPGELRALDEGRALPAPPLMLIVSWDGAGDLVVDELLADGRLPHLARLAEAGAGAEHSIVGLPSKTAVGHAVLWTGCGASCNGISGNSTPLLPAAEHTLLERRRGFSSEALLAEPLYVTAAKAGKRVVVLSATQSYPPQPHRRELVAAGVPAERYLSVSGFENVIARSRVLTAAAAQPAREAWRAPPGSLEIVEEVGDSRFLTLLFDDPEVATQGLDTARVCQGEASPECGFRLRPASATASDLGSWSKAVAVSDGEQRGHTLFRLFALSPDGRDVMLYRRAVHHLDGLAPEAELEAYRRAYPGFHDTQFRLYEDGALGPPMMMGGSGEAEDRVLELTALDVELSRRATLWALQRWRPEVVFHYLPMADPAGHTWMGLLDPASPRHDAAMAARIEPYYHRVFVLLDDWLGAITAALPAGSSVALTSDHGMAGVGQNLLVNEVLAAAGLLVWRADGGIDLGRTRALAPAFGDAFSIKVNDVSWKQGIVPLDQRSRVLDQAAAALLAARDPLTGEALVRRVFRPEEEPELGGGGVAGGDLYFDPAPGYYPRAWRGEAVVAPTRLPWGAGQHGFPPRRRSMHAIFYAQGPGFARGVVAPAMRHIDFAPTLAAVLGIPAPAQAEGRVVTALLDPAP